MRGDTLRIAFYIAFALWFTATRYSEPGIYAALLGPMVGAAISLALVSLFGIVVVVIARGAVRKHSFPWIDLISFVCSIVSFELVWRFVLSRTADLFKITSLPLDIATPFIAAVGIAVLVSDIKKQRPLTST